MENSRYIVGIDLGTTNCVIAYADTENQETDETEIHLLRIPQLVAPGVVEERDLLPSFLYLPPEHELSAGGWRLPWAEEASFVVGEFARDRGGEVPDRLISSAKSWLCHIGVDRTAPILPWGGVEELHKMSPLEVSAQYLMHVRNSWDYLMARDNPEYRLEKQDVLLTVPASFDAAARDLTVQSAERAGLSGFKLLEEPQAAFYAWIESTKDRWRKQVKVGDIILVCDVGGGTTDLSLIAVSEENGELVLKRIAVGEHILLGGDNMDLTLAYTVQQRLAKENTRLDNWQMRGLWHSCRAAKENLLQERSKKSQPVVILGRGKGVVGGTIRTELTAEEVKKVLVDGFFPACASTDRPQTQRRVGMQEMGLPYAADPGIIRHLAKFLGQQETQNQLSQSEGNGCTFLHPTAVLFNGGVMKADLLCQRVAEVLNSWTTAEGGEKVRVFTGTHPEQAVAYGAVYYGLARRGQGIRIRGGSPRTYYIGVSTSMPAVPGIPAPLKALCVVPFGMEEGTETDIPGQEFGLVVGEPVEFRFLGSTTRRGDQTGTLIEEWGEEIGELTPLETVLSWEGQGGMSIPVRLHARVTEVGTLELWCVSRDESHRWKLEFNVRTPVEEE